MVNNTVERILPAGSLFGEITLVTESPCLATITAIGITIYIFILITNY